MDYENVKDVPGVAGRSAIASSMGIKGEISGLDALGVDGLRALWKRRFRKPVPLIQSADILRRLIAWKIQVECFGDLDDEARVRIQILMKAKKGGTDIAYSVRPRVGTILVREWRGVEHRVLVLEDGFEHREQRYQSLTHVARAITGTHWSGPRFFGVAASQMPAASKPEDKQ